MPDPKGDKLIVNVGAAECRRRLKGYGHGVRKIHSAGEQQVVVIHTATRQHFVELKARFADVGYQDGASEAGEPDSAP